jgi:hypothetical protein
MSTNDSLDKVIHFIGDREKVIKLSLLTDEIRRVSVKHSSAVPDSIGDKLFRKFLQLRYAMNTGYLTQSMVDEANQLLEESTAIRRSASE